MTDLIQVQWVSSYQQTALYIYIVNRLIMYICFYCYPLFGVSHLISSQLNLPIKLVLTISFYPKFGYLLPSSHHSLLGFSHAPNNVPACGHMLSHRPSDSVGESYPSFSSWVCLAPQTTFGQNNPRLVSTCMGSVALPQPGSPDCEVDIQNP